MTAVRQTIITHEWLATFLARQGFTLEGDETYEELSEAYVNFRRTAALGRVATKVYERRPAI